MLTWTLIGVIVGLAMGLTGAGAALISVPLFVQLLDFDLKTATSLGLTAILVGSMVSWVFQRRLAHYSIALTFALFSYVTSALLAPIKKDLPDLLIQILFAAVGLYSLIMLWRKDRSSDSSRSGSFRQWMKKIPRSIQIAATGLLTGVLATLTGLGGGIIMVPTLIGPLKMTGNQAVATSLFAILLIASGSMFLQWEDIRPHLEMTHLLMMAFGTAVSALIIRKSLEKASPEKIQQIRRWTLTAMILAATLSVWHSKTQ